MRNCTCWLEIETCNCEEDEDYSKMRQTSRTICKEYQRRLISDIMREDEESGIYEKQPKMTREIKYIVLHCTATNQNAKVSSIVNYWKNEKGWKSPGYHFLIDKHGEIHELHPIEKPSNGVAGYNQNSIHISYIGGIGKDGKGLDNRTPEQILSQIKLVTEMKSKFPKAEILGHRDFPNVKKECPSFDVKEWLKSVGI